MTVGILVGATFLLLALFGTQFWPDRSADLKLDIWRLEAPAQSEICTNSTLNSLPESENRFFVYDRNTPQYFRLKIHSPPAAEKTAVYLGPTVDRATLVACSEFNTEPSILMIGSQLPLSATGAPHPRTIFQLTPELANSKLILRIDQDAAASLPIAAAPLDSYLENYELRHQIKLALYGAVAMIVIYNLSLSFLLRNRTLLFNALTSASMLTLDATITGFGLTYLWPESPGTQDFLLIISLAGPTIFGPHFFSSFLGYGKGEPGSRHYFYYPWTIFSVLIVALWFTGVADWIVTGALVAGWILSAFVVLLDLIRLALTGNERAAILLVPFFAAIIPPMFIGATREYLGWSYGLLGHHHTQIALVMEAVFFTLAVAYLIRLAQSSELRALRKLNAVSNQTAKRLVEAIDAERTRISRDLHDSAGQSFVLIASQLGKLKNDPRLGPKVRSEINKIGEVVTGVLNDVRQTTHDMYPPALDHLGLEKALRQQLTDIEEASGVDFTFKFVAPEGAITRKRAAQIFRILQELVSNIVKHSGANKSTVSVIVEGNNCTLLVADNGIWKNGVDPGSGSPGIGLSILEKRVDMLSGTMTMRTGKDGTATHIRFPLTTKSIEAIR